MHKLASNLMISGAMIMGMLILSGCSTPVNKAASPQDSPQFFMLRPQVEKAFGYTHAVRTGRYVKVSGAVSMDMQGAPSAAGDMKQQMINVYSDLGKILSHYGYTFDDVIVENVYTTDMAKFTSVSSYRASIYKKQFPTGTWVQVESLALPEFMIEIELEAFQ